VVKIEVNCRKSRSFVEIDAIKIIGTSVVKPTPATNSSNVEQWVSKVINYSSQWDGQR